MSGTGIYNPATVQLLGSGTSNGDGSYTLSGVNTSGWVGDQTLFAVAYDSTGATDSPVASTVIESASPQYFDGDSEWGGWSKAGVGVWKEWMHYTAKEGDKGWPDGAPKNALFGAQVVNAFDDAIRNEGNGAIRDQLEHDRDHVKAEIARWKTN